MKVVNKLRQTDFFRDKIRTTKILNSFTSGNRKIAQELVTKYLDPYLNSRIFKIVTTVQSISQLSNDSGVVSLIHGHH